MNTSDMDNVWIDIWVVINVNSVLRICFIIAPEC